MGIAGAAVATVIAQGVCCIFCFWFILRRAKVLVPSRKDFSFDSALCRELLEQGFSMGFMLSIVSLGTVALQSSINVLGTQIIAAHTTARKLFGLLTMPFATVSCSNRHLHFPEQWVQSNMTASVRVCIRQIC